MKKLFALKPYLARYKWRYFIGIICLIAVDVLQLIIPKLLGNITDMLKMDALSVHKLPVYIAIIVGLSILISIGRYMWRIYIIGSSRKVEYDLRNDLFAHLQKLSSNYFNNHKTGDIMAHATNDINAVRMAIGQGIIMVTDAIVLTIISIAIVLTINVKLTLLALFPLPFLALAAAKFGRIIHRRFTSVQDAFSKLTDKVQENFSGIRVIKSFVQEESEINKFTEENIYNMNMNMKLINVSSIFFPMVQFIAAISFVVILGYGGKLVVSGDISLGGFVSFIIYLGNLMWPMMALGWVINMLQRGAASMERIQIILDEKPEIFDSPEVENINKLSGAIEFRNLSFTYPGSTKPALNNINLSIKKGSTLGIVGRTGSGKTTLMNLLVRLYNVENGTIFLDGNDINRLPLSTIRQNIGYVPQDNFLFSSTIKENISFAMDEINMEDIEHYSKVSQVYDNIMDFPDKFETMVGERGVTLSGGQKQRISIARALIKDPPILILDDSLSAVDTKTEEEILKELKKITSSRTSIIISHRISSIKDADEIVVLDEGTIIERGTHNELIKLEGLYYDIYQKQLLEEKIEEE